MASKAQKPGWNSFLSRDCTVHGTGPNLRTGPVPFSMHIMSNSFHLWAEIGTTWLLGGTVNDFKNIILC